MAHKKTVEGLRQTVNAYKTDAEEKINAAYDIYNEDISKALAGAQSGIEKSNEAQRQIAEKRRAAAYEDSKIFTEGVKSSTAKSLGINARQRRNAEAVKTLDDALQRSLMAYNSLKASGLSSRAQAEKMRSENLVSMRRKAYSFDRSIGQFEAEADLRERKFAHSIEQNETGNELSRQRLELSKRSADLSEAKFAHTKADNSVKNALAQEKYNDSRAAYDDELLYYADEAESARTPTGAVSRKITYSGNSREIDDAIYGKGTAQGTKFTLTVGERKMGEIDKEKKALYDKVVAMEAEGKTFDEAEYSMSVNPEYSLLKEENITQAKAEQMAADPRLTLNEKLYFMLTFGQKVAEYAQTFAEGLKPTVAVNHVGYRNTSPSADLAGLDFEKERSERVVEELVKKFGVPKASAEQYAEAAKENLDRRRRFLYSEKNPLLNADFKAAENVDDNFNTLVTEARYFLSSAVSEDEAALSGWLPEADAEVLYRRRIKQVDQYISATMDLIGAAGENKEVIDVLSDLREGLRDLRSNFEARRKLFAEYSSRAEYDKAVTDYNAYLETPEGKAWQMSDQELNAFIENEEKERALPDSELQTYKEIAYERKTVGQYEALTNSQRIAVDMLVAIKNEHCIEGTNDIDVVKVRSMSPSKKKEVFNNASTLIRHIIGDEEYFKQENAFSRRPTFWELWPNFMETDYIEALRTGAETVEKRRQEEENIAKYTEWTKNMPVLMNLLSTLSIFAAPFDMLALLSSALNSGGRYKVHGYAPGDNNMGNALFRDTVRQTTSEMIDNDIGNFFYSAGSSILDMGVTLPLNAVLPGSTLVILGSSAGASAASQAIAEGETAWGALAIGFRTAAIEAVTEKISLGSLNAFTLTAEAATDVAMKSVKQVISSSLKNIGKQAVVEFTEEALASTLNTTFDWMQRGGNSELSRAVNSYMINEGMSEEEAQQRVTQDTVVQILTDGLAGAFSGFALGTTASVSNTIYSKSVANNPVSEAIYKTELGEELQLVIERFNSGQALTVEEAKGFAEHYNTKFKQDVAAEFQRMTGTALPSSSSAVVKLLTKPPTSKTATDTASTETKASTGTAYEGVNVADNAAAAYSEEALSNEAADYSQISNEAAYSPEAFSETQAVPAYSPEALNQGQRVPRKVPSDSSLVNRANNFSSFNEQSGKYKGTVTEKNLGNNSLIFKAVEDADITDTQAKARVKAAEIIAGAFGAEAVIYSGDLMYNGNKIENADGFNDGGGTIYLNADSKNIASFIIGHELGHSAIDAGGRTLESFKNLFIKLKYEGSTERFMQAVRDVAEDYRPLWGDLSPAEQESKAAQELMADSFGEFFERLGQIQSEAQLKEVLEQNRSFLGWLADKLKAIIQRLKNAIKRIGKKMSKAEAEQYKEMRRQLNNAQKLERMVRKMLLEVMDKGVTKTENGEVKLIIEKDKDGHKYVKIDGDILGNAPKSEWKEITKEYMKKFTFVTLGKEVIKLNYDSRKEVTGSEDTEFIMKHRKKRYRHKLMAMNNIDELLAVSNGYVNEEPHHKRRDSFIGFGRGTTRFMIDGKMYNADVVVGITSQNELVFHDIMNLKRENTMKNEEEAPAWLASQNTPNNRVNRNSKPLSTKSQKSIGSGKTVAKLTGASSSDGNSISKSNGKVNDKSMNFSSEVENGEKKTADIQGKASIKSEKKAPAEGSVEPGSKAERLARKKAERLAEKKRQRVAAHRENAAEFMKQKSDSKAEADFVEKYSRSLKDYKDAWNELKRQKEYLKASKAGTEAQELFGSKVKRAERTERTRYDRLSLLETYPEYKALTEGMEGKRVNRYRSADERSKALLKARVEEGKRTAAEIKKQGEEAVKAERKKSRETLRDAKRQSAETVKNEKKILREKFIAQKQAVEKREYVKKIDTKLKTFATWLSRPDVKKGLYVQDGMQAAAVDFLTSFSPLMPETRFVKSRGIETELKGNKANNEMWRKKLGQFAKKMRDSDNQGQGGFSPEVSRAVDRFRYDTEGKSFSELTLEQTKELSRLISIVQSTVKNANKLQKNKQYARVSEVAEDTIKYCDNLKRRPTLNKIGKPIGFTKYMTPAYIFKRFGKAGESLYNEIIQANDEYVKHVRRAKEFTDGLKKNYKKEFARMRKGEGRKPFSVTLNSSGETVEMSLDLGERISIYLYSEREQARKHIVGPKAGGIVLSSDTLSKIEKNLKEISKAERKKSETESKKTRAERKKEIELLFMENAVSFTEEELKRITSSLDDRELQLAKEMSKFYREVGDWGNATTLERYEIKMFTENNYVPIKTKQSLLAADVADRDTAAMYALDNLGFTKQTEPNANNPIMLVPAFKALANHIQDMGLYSAYSIAANDLAKWLNYSVKQVNLETDKTYAVSVRDSIRRAYDEDTVKYIETFIADIAGQRSEINTDRLFMRNIRRVKTALVGGNLRVVIQQPMAYIRAAAVLSPKYLSAALAHATNIPKTIKEMRAHNGLAYWKGLGYFEHDIARPIQDTLLNNKKLGDRVTDLSMVLAGAADDVTWMKLWVACKMKVNHDIKGTDIVRNSEQYWEAVNNQFNTIITQTQVVDSVITKNEVSRSKGGLTKIMAAFKNEPFASWNVLTVNPDMFVRVTDSKEKGKYLKKTFRNLAVFASNVIATAAATAVFGALRHHDDDKDYGERFFNEWMNDIFDEMVPLSQLPYWGELSAAVHMPVKHLINGVFPEDFPVELNTRLYNSSNLALAPVDALNEVITALMKGWDGGTLQSGDVYSFVYTVLDATSLATGIPMSNLLREAATIADTVLGLKGMDKFSVTYSKSDKYAAMYKAMLEGDNEQLEYHRQRARELGATDKEIANGLKKMLREFDSRIDEAARLKASGTDAYDRAGALIDEVVANGFELKDVIEAVNTVAKNKYLPVEESTENDSYRFDKAIAAGITASDVAEASFALEDINKQQEQGDFQDVVNGKLNAVRAYVNGTDLNTEQKQALLEGMYGNNNPGILSEYISAKAAISRINGISTDTAESLADDISKYYYKKKEGTLTSSDTDMKYAEISGYNLAKYAAYKKLISDTEGIKDKNGDTVQGSQKKNVMALLKTLDWTTDEKLLYLKMHTSWTSAMGMSKSEYNARVRAYINRLNISQSDKEVLLAKCKLDNRTTKERNEILEKAGFR